MEAEVAGAQKLPARSQDVRLIDLGLAIKCEIARNSQVAPRKSLQGQAAAGTPDFAAPEQMGKRNDPIGPWSDVYGFGRFCCYTLFRTPTPLFDHWLSVPKELAKLLNGCLPDNPTERFSGFQPILDILEGLQQPQPASRSCEPESSATGVGVPASAGLCEDGLKPVLQQSNGPFTKTIGNVGDIIEIPLNSSLKMKFAWVPSGESWLEGGGGEPGQTKFTLTKSLWCGVYPVTQAEWQAMMGDNPSCCKNYFFWAKSRNPVESVSWDRVQEFLKALNDKLHGSGLSYRLPTEQEWEYICRGGPLSNPEQSKYDFYFARSNTDLTPAPTNDLSSRQANFNGNQPAGAADCRCLLYGEGGVP